MASKYLRGQNWWVKYRHPVSGELVRESLETGSEAQAELLRQRVDLEVALLEPRLQTLITYLDELGAVQVQNFIEGLGVSRKTMRH